MLHDTHPSKNQFQKGQLLIVSKCFVRVSIFKTLWISWVMELIHFQCAVNCWGESLQAKINTSVVTQITGLGGAPQTRQQCKINIYSLALDYAI